MSIRLNQWNIWINDQLAHRPGNLSSVRNSKTLAMTPISRSYILICVLALLASCASRPQSPAEAVKNFGVGGVWIREGIFKDYGYARLKQACTSSGGSVAGYDEDGYEEGDKLPSRRMEHRRPALLVCSENGQPRWGVSFEWYNERLVAPFLSDKKEAAISVSASLLSSAETARQARQIVGKTERQRQAETNRAIERGQQTLSEIETENRRRARIQADSPAFRDRVKEGDYCHVPDVIGIRQCLVIAVKKPLVQVQVGNISRWIRLDELLAP